MVTSFIYNKHSLIYVLLISFFILISQNLQAKTFEALVDKTEFSKTENIKVNIQLRNNKAISEPDISKFYQAGFSLVKQHKFVKTSIINGKHENIINWSYSFKTKYTGKLTLPSVSIKTKQGKLHTTPIPIVIHNKATQNTLNKHQLYVESKIQNHNPLINQNLIYTIKITRFINIYKPQISPPASENAVIEKVFDSEEIETIINGRNAIINKYYYLVTPIKAGKVIISAPIIQGHILNRKQEYVDPFNIGNIINFSSLQKYQEFTISGQDLTLNVAKEKYSNYSWLPAQSLKISVKDLKLDNIKVGDALTANIVLEGFNLTENQLPNIEFPEINNLKIYPETPIKNTSYNIETKKITSYKTLKFTMIPTDKGNITFPAIKIAWWDIKNKKLRFAKTKELTFIVTHNKENQGIIADNDYSINQVPNTSNNNLLYLSLTLNAILLLILARIIHNRKKFQTNKKTTKSANKISIKHHNNAEELRDFCLEYFKKKFNINSNNLEELINQLEISLPCKSLSKLKNIFTQLNDDIYGNKQLPKNIKKQLQKLLKKLPKKNIKTPSNKNFSLNPF